jgi:hypothetical protein
MPGATLHFWKTEEGLKTLEAHPELGARASRQPTWAPTPARSGNVPHFPAGVYLDPNVGSCFSPNPICHVPADEIPLAGDLYGPPCDAPHDTHVADLADEAHVRVAYPPKNRISDSADPSFAAGGPAVFANQNVSDNRPHTSGDRVERAMADWPELPQGQVGFEEKPYGTLPRTLRTPGFDVYGAPRKSMPRLSGTFAMAAAAAAPQRNERYLETEGGTMRPVRTASANLARYAPVRASGRKGKGKVRYSL